MTRNEQLRTEVAIALNVLGETSGNDGRMATKKTLCNALVKSSNPVKLMHGLQKEPKKTGEKKAPEDDEATIFIADLLARDPQLLDSVLSNGPEQEK